jgi:adenine-specific DNA-methyltransferase
MDAAADPALFWAGKRSSRKLAVLPLQRNEVVSESRIAQIVARARKAAETNTDQLSLGSVFAELEKSLRDTDKSNRVQFYTHEEGWKNKLICGDSLPVMESLMHYEGLRGAVQMAYIDPPYGVSYNTNIQQRIDTTQNVRLGTTGKKAGELVKVSESAREPQGEEDLLSIKAFRDTWTLGIHSYLSFLHERLYLVREMLADTGSVFVQISDTNQHLVRVLMDEVFGASNFCSMVTFRKKMMPLGAEHLESVSDYLLWYAKDVSALRAYPIYRNKRSDGDTQWSHVELSDGSRRRLKAAEVADHSSLPKGSKIFQPISMMPADYRPNQDFKFQFDGKDYDPPKQFCWKTDRAGMETLAKQKRLFPAGDTLRYVYYFQDYPVSALTNLWADTKGADNKQYIVQTSETVVSRCIQLASDPGDLVLDITCGAGTTAACAEQWGRRWITCDTSRVAINVARQRLLTAVFDNWRCHTTGKPATGFTYERAPHVSMETLTKGQEDAGVELRDRPGKDSSALRVTGPFEVLTIGRYSPEDWKGYIVGPSEHGESGVLEDYIKVIARLYRNNAAVQGASGFVHAISESEGERIAISVGPLSGRVSAKQVNDAVSDARASGLSEVHVLGWAYEANVGEVKARLESGNVKVELIMIRPDTLADGLKVTKAETLFSPLAVPDLDVEISEPKGEKRQVTVRLNGVAVFDRKSRGTDYKSGESGYISAWYLDEDYDGDCFVASQIFFDFKKAPNLKNLGISIEARELKLGLQSEPFAIGSYRRIAARVVDVFGNESTVVSDL